MQSTKPLYTSIRNIPAGRLLGNADGATGPAQALGDVAARALLGLGTAALAATGDFDAAGAAASVASSLSAHVAAADPHGDRAYAASLVSGFSQQGVFTAASASVVPVTIKAAASQSGNLFEIRNSANTLTTWMKSDNHLVIGASGVSRTATAISLNGNGTNHGCISLRGAPNNDWGVYALGYDATRDASAMVTFYGRRLVLGEHTTVAPFSGSSITPRLMYAGSYWRADPKWFMGNGETHATPSNAYLSATGGSGANVAGASFYYDAGQGTGTGTGGSHVFRVAPAGSAGSSLNPLVDAVVISSTLSSTSPILKVLTSAGGDLFRVLSDRVAVGPDMTLDLPASTDGASATGRNGIRTGYGAMYLRSGNTDNVFLSAGLLQVAGGVTNNTIQCYDRGGSLTLNVIDHYGGPDTAGKDLIYQAGRGTGTAVGGAHRFKVAPTVGVSGTTFGTLTDGLVLDSNGVLFLMNSPSVPLVNPTGGGYLYVESGALKYRGSSGTVTTIAAA